MENEANPLVLELSRFQKLFQAHLSQPSSGESLKMEMLSSLDKCMSLARTSVQAAQQPPSPFQATDNDTRMMTNKRKTMTKSTREPRVGLKISTGDGVDGPLSDGFSWRKYGQKNIQHAKYPRCYYRCSHSETRDCAAKRQVQQSGENLSTFDVTYIGTHTCYPSPQQQSLNINTQVSGSDHASPSFSFPTTPESYLDSSANNNFFKGSFSPSPISPQMSGSKHFSVSECEPSGYGEGPSLHAESSNLADNILAANSAAISPFMGMDMNLMLNLDEFDPCFQLF